MNRTVMLASRPRTTSALTTAKTAASPTAASSVRILSGLTVLQDGSPVFLLDLNQLV